MLEHILAAVDGSESSRRAARFAHDLAQKLGSRLTLLLVLEMPSAVSFGPMESFGVTRAPLSPEQTESARRMLDEVAKDLPGEKVSKVVELGHAAEVICEQAEKLNADLIVIGARGLGPAGRWLLGSVSDRVAHHAKPAVTIVR